MMSRPVTVPCELREGELREGELREGESREPALLSFGYIQPIVSCAFEVAMF